ncbi:hypothetical protein D3C87_1238460 [compost metagenome]
MHAERRVDVQVIAGDALVDDQHDVVAHRFVGARQAYRFARADGVVQRFIGEQVQIGQRRVHLRQAAGPLARAHEQHRTEQQHTQHRCRHQQRSRHRQASTRLQANTEQQRQTTQHPPDDRIAVLDERLLDKTTGIHQRNKAAVGQVIGSDPRIHIKEHRRAKYAPGEEMPNKCLPNISRHEQRYCQYDEHSRK